MQYGYTALTYAAKHGYTDMALALLANGGTNAPTLVRIELDVSWPCYARGAQPTDTPVMSAEICLHRPETISGHVCLLALHDMRVALNM
eukprot:354734-Chlamydomonas_euryale.AAC.11